MHTLDIFLSQRSRFLSLRFELGGGKVSRMPALYVSSARARARVCARPYAHEQGMDTLRARPDQQTAVPYRAAQDPCVYSRTRRPFAKVGREEDKNQ